MNENQREFIINKIEKYQDEVDSIRKGQSLSIVIASINVIMVILSSMRFSEYCHNQNYFKALLDLLVMVLNSASGIYMVSYIFEGITKKAGLEISIRDLQNQLEIDDREEIILKRRR